MPRSPRKTFEKHFHDAFEELRPSYTGKKRPDWTKFMYRVLHTVAARWPVWCECREKHASQPGTVPGERLHIDFFWYARRSRRGRNPKDDAFDPPLVVIEHENLQQRLPYNLWKVTQLCAPLRVLVGYVNKEGSIDGVATELLGQACEYGLSTPSGSEDLILLSDYRQTLHFRSWHRSDGESWRDVARRHEESSQSKKRST